jgi:hypothetical protein
MAAHYLRVNGAAYAVLGVLFVLRGAMQGLGRTLVPTLSGALELVMRIGAALTLGTAFGYAGVVWSNPLAWIGSVLLLVPAYVTCHRALGRSTSEDAAVPLPGSEPALVVRRLHRLRPRRGQGALPAGRRTVTRRAARQASRP